MDNQQYVEDITGRYVYEVLRQLPPKQRGDIDRELHSLIEDMLAERTSGRESGREDIDQVLLELGSPSALADKYRGSARYLIGPGLYDLYLMILKIVLGATAFGMIVAMTVSYIATPPVNIVDGIADFFSAILSGVFQAFAWVTLGFAVADRLNPKRRPSPKRNGSLGICPRCLVRAQKSNAVNPLWESYFLCYF